MILNFIIAILTLFLAACNSPENPVIVVTEDSVTAPVVDTPSVVISDPFADSLRAYLENPCDLYTIKKETPNMLDGGSADMKAEWFHPVSDSTVILYTYWATEFEMKKNNFKNRSLQYATWKPWKTAAQKYYETDNETLVGIRCSVYDERLGPSNFVGMHIDSVKAKFGEPQAKDERYATVNSAGDSNNTTSVYFMDDRLLLLNEKNKKVNWFKYYWWHENIESVDSLPELVFEWH